MRVTDTTVPRRFVLHESYHQHVKCSHVQFSSQCKGAIWVGLVEQRKAREKLLQLQADVRVWFGILVKNTQK